ncbi:MAG: 16S rRNA (cytidine(1402)-2'-O)-methyltransferase [Planctomycetes bacterium]|nr:16S rRNA (cytidine(1402)-2'-O)-methyltransferase [Planctomycetota bacterium]
MNTGTLYLVSTPIGNLEDITLRALRVLKEVDLIACEDTRVTANLLNHYQVKKPLARYFEPAWQRGSYNKNKQARVIIDRLLAGSNIALVSNAGTPLISDPGYELVNLCVDNDIPVKVVPGASAFVSALALAGLPSDKFIFEGFLPKKPSKRRKRLQEIASDSRTIVIYESPYRIFKTLSELKDTLGNRKIVLSRELTKFYEEVIRGDIEGVIKQLGNKKIKGEFTLVIQGAEHD